MSQPSLTDSSPTKPPQRPRIILPIPMQQSPPHSPGHHYNSNPLYVNPMNNGVIQQAPMTPVQNPYMMNPFGMYPTKASDFMFKQLGGFKDFTMNTAKSGLSVGEKSAFWMYNKISSWSRKWFTHFFLTLVVLIYSVCGAAIFVAIEGAHETRELEDIQEARYNLVGQLRALARSGPEEDMEWEGAAVRKIRAFENQLYKSYSHGVSDKGTRVWTFWNAAFYCGTIYTTIGYGHISPSTTTGRAITIVYAIFGIPLFLILLADFGKLFTRGIKFLWAFVRRLYYTGSCRRIRKNETAQEVMKGVQMVYEIATFRRPSQSHMEEGNLPPLAQPPSLGTSLGTSPGQAPSENSIHSRHTHLTADRMSNIGNETPNTPAPSNFAVDDEFNLPISVAILVLLLYILSGALMYWTWENWSFFEAFYFVFISMSTIGFGDFVPEHPMFMMASIVYLVFGLALTSMCINVVQVKLSDTFRQASAKISTTIGLKIAAEEDGSVIQVPMPNSVELADVHLSQKTEESEKEKIKEKKKDKKKDKGDDTK